MSISTGTPKRNRNPFFHNNEIWIKKPDWIEFRGATIERGFKLVRLLPVTKFKDGNVLIIGSDLKDLKVMSKHTLGIIVDMGGDELVQGIENAFELLIHQFFQFILGVYNKNPCSRNLWLYIDKKKVKSFEYVGKFLNRLFKAEIPKIERIQTSFFIDKANSTKN